MSAENQFNRIEDEIQQYTFRNELSKAGINLIYTGTWLKTAHSDFFKSFGITWPQHNLLRILRGQKGKPVNVNAVKERMMDKSSNVSRITEKLQKKKLIECRPSLTDKRSVDITITQKGLDLLSTVESRVHEINNLLSHLESGELVLLNMILDKIRNGKDNPS
ncbi:MarR family winged helix-turn-helix transcriptional regulator [Dyadobacter sp. NIV53]|uniref:MarR family winged helix-turn-helix transcriptional regulator n=1 Tax=Dyadobacter sp. NIV53 TaxID=2861765 RepID=UPI001C882141|nr:MarR family transcriptional regulator [Dyadobacter sp. NIV53]